MSRIAANETYGGNMLRKAIDYFSHLAVDPKWYPEMTKDEEFAKTDYAPKLKWLKDDNDDIYDPDYSDMLRVAFMSQYPRGKMKDLVSLLQGRDFETKDFKESIAEETFKNLSNGVLDYMNEYNFKQFVLAIKDAGFISKKLITSDITLDFAYTLYLRLLKDSSIDKTKVKNYVQRWYVMSTLTGRYISSPESAMDLDLRRIKEKGFLPWLEEVEKTLSDTFWNVELVQNLETSSVNSPYLCVFWAASCREGSDSLFNEGSKFSNLITTMGDVHHIFPKQYLIDNGIKDKAKYNQVANFTYLDTPTNIAVGKDEPCKYFTKVFEQCKTGEYHIGNLKSEEAIKKNLPPPTRKKKRTLSKRCADFLVLLSVFLQFAALYYEAVGVRILAVDLAQGRFVVGVEEILLAELFDFAVEPVQEVLVALGDGGRDCVEVAERSDAASDQESLVLQGPCQDFRVVGRERGAPSVEERVVCVGVLVEFEELHVRVFF